eukprot:tig00000361_g24381.t1
MAIHPLNLSNATNATGRVPDERNETTTVFEQVEELWETVTEGTDQLTRDRYIPFHSCMFRALRTEFNEKDAFEKAWRDFIADSKGNTCVPKERFSSMMVTLAERWTAVDGQIQPDLAALFLQKLLHSITYMAPDGERLLLPYASVQLGSCIPSSRRKGNQTHRPPASPPQTGVTRQRSFSESGPSSPSPPQRQRLASEPSGSSGSHGAAEAAPASSESPSLSLRRFALVNAARQKQRTASPWSISPAAGGRPQTGDRGAFSRPQLALPASS